MMVEVAHAMGSYFYTPEGKRYIDLVAGVSVSNVGHCNSDVVTAVQSQVAKYMHIMVYGELVERPQVEYATLLSRYLPDPLSSIYFVNSGAEAIDGAMKLARRSTGRKEIISMRRAYHGSTQGAMSLMGSPDGDIWTSAFEPLIPECRSIDYNSFDDLTQITHLTAAVVCEPVQGEAGIRPPAEGYLKALRKRCDEVGALLIFDEIQSGMGRCGEIFASIKYGVTPDIMTLAKAFGGGMPLGAFISSADIMGTLTHNPVLGHITTFGGHPVCCAAGMAALNYLINNNIIEQVEAKGSRFESTLINHPLVHEIRRSGLLMAVELGESTLLYRLMEIFKEMGIMSDWFLFCDTAFRISPPLTISEEEIDESCQLIIESLNQL
ncbi:MAG: aspartate aminotransferase family protein [Rikenellaceae bacterium]